MSISGIRLSGQGALVQWQRMDGIAQNLAQGLGAGFRARAVGIRALPGGWSPEVDGARIDPRPGALQVTGRALDLALRGPGYFAVRDLGTGDTLYTRAGNFNIDSSGRLVAAGGRCQVLASDGRPIALGPESTGSLRVAPDGTLSRGDVEYGQLGVVEFEDVARLATRGDGLFENRGSALGGSPDSRIEQGALERSSVDPALETAELTRALRALEANLEMLRIQDAALERTVSELARPAR